METILIHQLQTLDATIWLQIPEFGKNQQKHSVKVNWLDETYNKEYWWEVGEGIRMGNTYKSMADSCQCMAKTTTVL